MFPTTAATLPLALDDIRALRRAAGLSQVELAVRAGCSPSFVGQVEQGYQPPSSAAVARIRAVLAQETPTAA